MRVVENFPQLLWLRVRQSGFAKRKKIQETSSNRGSMALIKKFFRSVFIILLNFGCNKSLRIVAITWYSTYFENMTKGRRCRSAIQRSRSQPLDQPPKTVWRSLTVEICDILLALFKGLSVKYFGVLIYKNNE